ncbi:hypothetical protein [Smaragdicoccus niigatensis]|uniref:hypothetical protein n=1 Tax=Smaragdicoccus niigatensis TaxID=359359 RepID=UPI0012DD761F|nr:hypothetical protein [Smaragdicoccus niigatensis]
MAQIALMTAAGAHQPLPHLSRKFHSREVQWLRVLPIDVVPSNQDLAPQSLTISERGVRHDGLREHLAQLYQFLCSSGFSEVARHVTHPL